MKIQNSIFLKNIARIISLHFILGVSAYPVDGVGALIHYRAPAPLKEALDYDVVPPLSALGQEKQKKAPPLALTQVSSLVHNPCTIIPEDMKVLKKSLDFVEDIMMKYSKNPDFLGDVLIRAGEKFKKLEPSQDFKIIAETKISKPLQSVLNNGPK